MLLKALGMSAGKPKYYCLTAGRKSDALASNLTLDVSKYGFIHTTPGGF
jgi:hypothetical protein